MPHAADVAYLIIEEQHLYGFAVEFQLKGEYAGSCSLGMAMLGASIYLRNSSLGLLAAWSPATNPAYDYCCSLHKTGK